MKGAPPARTGRPQRGEVDALSSAMTLPPRSAARKPAKEVAGSAMAVVLSAMSLLDPTTFGNNVRRAGSNSRPRPCRLPAIQLGPKPRIAHSFSSRCENPGPLADPRSMAAAATGQQTISFVADCCFSCGSCGGSLPGNERALRRPKRDRPSKKPLTMHGADKFMCGKRAELSTAPLVHPPSAW